MSNSTLSAAGASAPTRSGSGESRVAALDGLRGVAIILVLLVHFAPYAPGIHAPTALIDRLYLRISAMGGVGVDLFFVLSGYLITGILCDTKGSKHYFRQFYVRRVLRIFPIYYVALVLLLVILPWPQTEQAALRELRADAVWYWTYLYNFKVAATGYSPLTALGHFWSLAVEEQFYLFWPLVVLWLGRRHLLVACVVAVVGALVCRLALASSGYVVLPDVWTPARMDALAVGAFIAVMSRMPGGLAAMRRWAGPVALGVALPLAVLLRYKIALATVSHTLLALLFGAILVLLVTASPTSTLARTSASPALRFFGRYSYALYIFHHPLLWLRPIFSLAFVPTVFGSQLPAYLLWLSMATGVTVAVALVSWHVVEKPFLSLKRFFPYHSPEVAPSTITVSPPPYLYPKATAY
jgi:peptidoglycan/LPS O-acetylase OafA/YrhL